MIRVPNRQFCSAKFALLPFKKKGLDIYLSQTKPPDVAVLSLSAPYLNWQIDNLENRWLMIYLRF